MHSKNIWRNQSSFNHHFKFEQKQTYQTLQKQLKKSPSHNNQHRTSYEKNNTLNTCGRGEEVKEDFSP